MKPISIKMPAVCRWMIKKTDGTVALVPMLLLLFVCLILSIAYRDSIVDWMSGCMAAVTN